MLDWFFKKLQSSRTTTLEQFIASQNPKDIVDVERLMKEYDKLQQRRQLWG
jgi:hypothetical protein